MTRQHLPHHRHRVPHRSSNRPVVVSEAQAIEWLSSRPRLVEAMLFVGSLLEEEGSQPFGLVLIRISLAGFPVAGDTLLCLCPEPECNRQGKCRDDCPACSDSMSGTHWLWVSDFVSDCFDSLARLDGVYVEQQPPYEVRLTEGWPALLERLGR